jgi:hypothetical protein
LRPGLEAVSHPQAKKPNEIMVRNSILPAALNWGSIGSVQEFGLHARRGRGMRIVMFIALLGYIGTMVAAFATLVVVWHVIGPPQLEAVRQQPRPIGVVTQAATPVSQPGTWGPAVIHKADEGVDAAASAEDARLAAAQAVAAEKAKRLKQARYQKRKEQEQLARQRDDQQYSTALGYDQEPRDVSQPSGFNFFGPRRF